MTRKHLINELTIVVNKTSNPRDITRAIGMREVLESGFDLIEETVMEFINQAQENLA